MNRYKTVVSVLVSIILVCTAFPVCFTAFADDPGNYVIWEANVDTILRDNDSGINAPLKYTVEQPIVLAKKGYSASCNFYRAEFAGLNSINNSGISVVRSAFSSSDSGFGWMGNRSVLNALSPFITVAFQYRISSESNLPDDAVLTFYAANDDNIKISKIAQTGISETDEWQVCTVKGIGDFSASWRSGFIGYTISSETVSSDQPINVDVSGFRFIINTAERNSINTALSGISGINRISNFTAGVSIPKYNGKDDYFSLLNKYDSKSAYSSSTDDSYHIVTVGEVFNADISLSRMRARGTGSAANSDSVTINVAIDEGYKITKIAVLGENGENIEVKTDLKNTTYSFIMPAFDVIVKVETEQKVLNSKACLWYCDPGTQPTAPWYYGSVKPFKLGYSEGDGESAYSLTLTAKSGTITVYGYNNVKEDLYDYLNTAVFKTKIRLDNTESQRVITLTFDDKNKYYVTVNNEWQEITVPLKNISSGNHSSLKVYFDNCEIDEKILIGRSVIWASDTEATTDEKFTELFDISDYPLKATNKLLGVIGDPETLLNHPWNEEGGYFTYDLAWFAQFREEDPWYITASGEAAGRRYQLVFYESNYQVSVSSPVIDLTNYIDTGYMEFYIKSDKDGLKVPIAVQSQKNGRKYLSFYVTYDKSKARPDGYMLVRVPFTYFYEMGLEVDSIKMVSIMGTFTIEENFYITAFRFYSNYAEIADPIPEVEEELVVERALPVELDSSVINAYLDKAYKELWVPENTMVWEILSALQFDSTDVYVNFIEDGITFYEDDAVLVDDMKMRVFRRDVELATFSIFVGREDDSPEELIEITKKVMNLRNAVNHGEGSVVNLNSEEFDATAYLITISAMAAGYVLKILYNRL